MEEVNTSGSTTSLGRSCVFVYESVLEAHILGVTDEETPNAAKRTTSFLPRNSPRNVGTEGTPRKVGSNDFYRPLWDSLALAGAAELAHAHPSVAPVRSGMFVIIIIIIIAAQVPKVTTLYTVVERFLLSRSECCARPKGGDGRGAPCVHSSSCSPYSPVRFVHGNPLT